MREKLKANLEGEGLRTLFMKQVMKDTGIRTNRE